MPCCGKPPWCLTSGAPAFCACRVAVNASILRSSSATRLSAFFWRLRVGGVVMHGRPAFAHRLHGRSGRSWSHRTLSPRHESQALGRFRSAGDFADPGVSLILLKRSAWGQCVRCCAGICRSAAPDDVRVFTANAKRTLAVCGQL